MNLDKLKKLFQKEIKIFKQNSKLNQKEKLVFKEITVKNIIIETCKSLENNLTNNKNINSSLSGSTAIFGLIVEKKMYMANIGDSKSYIIKKEENSFVCTTMNIEHTPKISSEKKRILNNGGEIRPYKSITFILI